MALPINTQHSKHLNLSRRLVFLGVAGSLLLATIYAHVHLAGSEEYTGPLAVLDHLFDLILALGLSVIVLCVGHDLGRRLGLNFANPAEDISFSIFFGTGVLGLFVLGLAFLGLLQRLPVAVLMMVAIVVTRNSWGGLCQIVGKAFRGSIQTRKRRFVMLLFLTVVGLFVLRTLAPPGNGDELTYHLPVTKEFVDQGRISPSYHNAFGNSPFLIHMLYAVCLLAGSDIAAKLFSLTLAITTAIAVYAFCCRFLSRQVGVIAIFAFFATGMLVEVAVTTRVDVSLTGMLFAATYAMINYLETNQRSWFWLSGILAGFCLGIKHSAALWLIYVGVMYLIERLVRKRERFFSVFTYGVAYVFIAAAVASPWYIKNYVWFHNPMYPFMTGEVADFGPKGIRYFDAADDVKLNLHFEHARQQMPEVVNAQEQELIEATHTRLPRHPLRLWEFFTNSESYLMSEPFHSPNYLFLLVPLILFVKPRRWVLWLLILSLAFALTVAAGSWIARYMLPAYPSLTIVVAYKLATLPKRISKSASFAEIVSLWPVVICLGGVLVVTVSLIVHFNTLHYVMGRMSRHQYLLAFPYQARTDFINTNLPTDSRVMLMGAQIPYGLKRDYLSDPTWFATEWRRLLVRNSSLEEVNLDLKQRGFTHILYCPRLFTYAAKMGIDGTGGTALMSQGQSVSDEARRLGPEYQLLRNWSTFTLYRSKFLEPIYLDSNGCEVLKIKE